LRRAFSSIAWGVVDTRLYECARIKIVFRVYGCRGVALGLGFRV